MPDQAAVDKKGSVMIFDHLKRAAKAANRELSIGYYFYHAWIAIRAGAQQIYLGVMSIVHAIFPFVYGGFGLARIVVDMTNRIRRSIPDWDGWKELDNWQDDKYK